MELVGVDVTWRSCIAGVSDPLFPSVCSNTSLPALAVAVTINAVWSTFPTTGPGKAVQDGSGTATGVLLRFSSVPGMVRRIGWYPAGDNNASMATIIPSNDPGGYLFTIQGVTAADQTYSSRL